MTKHIILILALIMPLGIFSQNAKKSFKNALKLFEAGQYYEALIDFNQAISTDTTKAEYYVARAKTFELIKNTESAALDYEKAALLEPGTAEYSYEAGKNNYLIGNFPKALKYLTEAVVINNNNFEAFAYKSLTYIKLEEYNNALIAIDNALKLEENNIYFCIRAEANDSLENYDVALVDYKKSIELNAEIEKPYYAITKVYLKKNDLELALQNAEITVKKFPSLAEAYEIRSQVFYAMKEIPAAINDLSKLETLVADPSYVLFTRGMYYFEYRQYQNAKSDFTQLININPDIANSFYWRGRANEEIMEVENALTDYIAFLNLSVGKKTDAALLDDAKLRIFELNREQIPPVITIENPLILPGNKLLIPFDAESFSFEGEIEDKSKIAWVELNGNEILNTENNTFNKTLNTANNQQISLTVQDVYGNETREEYRVYTLLQDKPTIIITNLNSNNKKEIYIESNLSNIEITGQIFHSNHISNILINKQPVTFNELDLNPSFSLNLNITSKNKLTIKTEDSMGLITETVFILVRIEPV